MTEFLTKKFWSQGTPLGYLGSGSQEALGLRFYRFQILVIWGPYDYPALVACQGQAENPKTAGARCDIGATAGHFAVQFFKTRYTQLFYKKPAKNLRLKYLCCELSVPWLKSLISEM